MVFAENYTNTITTIQAIQICMDSGFASTKTIKTIRSVDMSECQVKFCLKMNGVYGFCLRKA